MSYFDSNNNVYDQKNGVGKQEKPVTAGKVNFVRIFGYMGIGLLITAGFAFLFGYIFSKMFANDIASQNIPTPLIGIFIGVAIAQLIMSIVLSFIFLKGKHSLVVPSIIYCALFGVLFAPFTIYIDWRILGMAFGVTAAIFLLMTLIAALSKGNLSGLGLIGIGLICGAGLMALMSFLFIWLMPSVSATFIWIIDFVIFAAVMFITLFDIWNIKKICERNEMTTNLELYCALTIYNDFIVIFVRILYYLLVIYGKSK